MLHWDLSGALCGLSLVASGARGPQHVFSYLGDVVSTADAPTGDGSGQNGDGGTAEGRARHGMGHRRHLRNVEESTSMRGSDPAAGSGVQKGETEDRNHNENGLYGMPPQLFAHLMAPKGELCDKGFEVRLDDVKFVSFPTLLPREETTEELLELLPSLSDSGDGDSSRHASDDDGSPGKDGHDGGEEKGEAAVASESSSDAGETAEHGTQFLMFNIVFALDMSKSTLQQHERESKGKSQGNHDSLVTAYTEVARKLSAALVHEERRCRYLSSESAKIMELVDQSGSDDPESVTDIVLQCSPLANDLRRVFNGLREAGSVNVCVNAWVDLHLTLEDKTSIPSLPIRPYQTLLLLNSNQAVLEQLPEDASGELRLLIRSANPVRSFQELTVSTGIPLAQLFRLAAHLVYWEKGRIVDTITTHSTYVVAPHATPENATSIAGKFQQAFHSHELAETLGRFSLPKKMGEHLRPLNSQQQAEFINIVIFLQRHSLITQLHTYVVLQVVSDDAFEARAVSGSVLPAERGSSQRAPAEDEKGARGKGTATGANTREDGSPSSDSDSDEEDGAIPVYEGDDLMTVDDYDYQVRRTRGLTRAQRAYLNKIANDSPVYKLLRKLAPYFNGTFHLEEIMWRENLARADFTILLNTYKEVVICFTCEAS